MRPWKVIEHDEWYEVQDAVGLPLASNVDRVRACLHRNKAQLRPGCRGFIPGAHRPRPSGR
jgi:hypothetical protein